MSSQRAGAAKEEGGGWVQPETGLSSREARLQWQRDARARGDGVEEAEAFEGERKRSGSGTWSCAFLFLTNRSASTVEGLILHSSQEWLSCLPGCRAHRTQCHSAFSDNLSDVRHTKGDFIAR